MPTTVASAARSPAAASFSSRASTSADSFQWFMAPPRRKYLLGGGDSSSGAAGRPRSGRRRRRAGSLLPEGEEEPRGGPGVEAGADLAGQLVRAEWGAGRRHGLGDRLAHRRAAGERAEQGVLEAAERVAVDDEMGAAEGHVLFGRL